MNVKYPMRIAALAAAISCVASASDNRLQDYSETHSHDRTFPIAAGDTPKLDISNIWGPVTIRTHDERVIRARIREVRSARDAEEFEASYEWVALEESQRGGWVELHVDGGDDHRRWKPCRDCTVRYEFDVLAPADTIIRASTVMDGMVDVRGFSHVGEASNVNGSVYVQGPNRCGRFHSVNGDVEVEFVGMAQDADCSVETVNGDMTLHLPPSVSGRFSFDLFNGEFETEFPVTAAPTEPEVTRSGDGHKITITKTTAVQIGSGGPNFHFESINGDVLIRRADSRG